MIATLRRLSRLLVMANGEGRGQVLPTRRSPPGGGLRRLLKRSEKLLLLNARGGRAFGAFFGLVAHFGALGQGLEALTQDGAVMNEDVLRAIVGRDEPVALVVAEPLDSSSRHALPPLHVLRTRRMQKQRLRALRTTFAGTYRP